LHASTKAKDEMKGALLLDVVIREGPPILELLPGKDETLLIRWDSKRAVKTPLWERTGKAYPSLS